MQAAHLTAVACRSNYQGRGTNRKLHTRKEHLYQFDELEILRLVMAAGRNHDIANSLFISRER